MSVLPILCIVFAALVLGAGVVVGRFALTRIPNMKKEARRANQIIAESDRAFARMPAGGEGLFTVLVENHVAEAQGALQASHAVSILVERGGLSFLMDLGDGDVYGTNARALGKDLASVSFAFISHGHADHGGALAHFLKSNPTAPVYVSERAMLERHFARIVGPIRRDISLDATLVDRYPDRFEFPVGVAEIATDIFIIPTVARRHPIPAGNARLLKEASGRAVLDNFDHEQILVIRDHNGLVVFSGCCHNGILNVLDTVRTAFPDERLKGVIGGFHLFSATAVKMAETPEYVRSLGEAMLSSESTLFVTGHCTGTEAYVILKGILADRLAYFSTGRRFRL